MAESRRSIVVVVVVVGEVAVVVVVLVVVVVVVMVVVAVVLVIVAAAVVVVGNSSNSSSSSSSRSSRSSSSSSSRHSSSSGSSSSSSSSSGSSRRRRSGGARGLGHHPSDLLSLKLLKHRLPSSCPSSLNSSSFLLFSVLALNGRRSKRNGLWCLSQTCCQPARPDTTPVRAMAQNVLCWQMLAASCIKKSNSLLLL